MTIQMDLIESQEVLAVDAGQQMQLVRALSSLGDMPELLGHPDLATVLQDIKKAQSRLIATSSSLKDLRTEHANKDWWNFWSDSESRMSDAQLDLSAAMSDLNGQSTKLLLFNTAISKVICDMQGLLLAQQSKLDQQAGKLAQQNETLLDNVRKLEELHSVSDEWARKQDQFAARFMQIVVAIDTSQEEVHRRLADSSASLEALSERFEVADGRTAEFVARVTQIMVAIDASQEDMHRRLAECLASLKALSELLEGADRRTDEVNVRVAKFASAFESSLANLQRRVDDGDARSVLRMQELRQEFESSVAAISSMAADRERLVVELVRQGTEKSLEAIRLQMAQLQARCRSQGRLLLVTALGLAAAMAVAVTALVSHVAA